MPLQKILKRLSGFSGTIHQELTGSTVEDVQVDLRQIGTGTGSIIATFFCFDPDLKLYSSHQTVLDSVLTLL
jgi:hypothetical protein